MNRSSVSASVGANAGVNIKLGGCCAHYKSCDCVVIIGIIIVITIVLIIVISTTFLLPCVESNRSTDPLSVDKPACFLLILWNCRKIIIIVC